MTAMEAGNVSVGGTTLDLSVGYLGSEMLTIYHPTTAADDNDNSGERRQQQVADIDDLIIEVEVALKSAAIGAAAVDLVMAETGDNSVISRCRFVYQH